ncbi:hypothetical protein MBANPS3_008168 [Mucor bainieri]
MTHFQQAYTAYPSPAVVVNTPTPMTYQPYSQHPSMQPAYYPSMQPQIIQQPYYHQPGGYIQNHSSTLSQLYVWVRARIVALKAAADLTIAVEEALTMTIAVGAVDGHG